MTISDLNFFQEGRNNKISKERENERLSKTISFAFGLRFKLRISVRAFIRTAHPNVWDAAEKHFLRNILHAEFYPAAGVTEKLNTASNAMNIRVRNMTELMVSIPSSLTEIC